MTEKKLSIRVQIELSEYVEGVERPVWTREEWYGSEVTDDAANFLEVELVTKSKEGVDANMIAYETLDNVMALYHKYDRS